jgi:phosphatidylserine decarboxylase
MSGVSGTSVIPNNQLNNDNNKLSVLLDNIRVLPQYLLPQHLLCRIVFFLTRMEYSPWKTVLIRTFIHVFNVDMSFAEKQDASDYRHFNDFFTRMLKPDVRPHVLEKDAILSPVDGTISQIGEIRDDMIIQAKGHEYSLEQLLAVCGDWAHIFSNGKFATLYLSPRDYHRIHMPLDGNLQQMIYLPGKLFAVNAHTTRVVDGLFARNERVINIFETDIGPMAIIMVGAIFVGSMETVWEGQVTPSSKRTIKTIDYNRETISLQKGGEMGRFNMGSTVILLFSQGCVSWQPDMQAGRKILMGEQLGTMTIPSPVA